VSNSSVTFTYRVNDTLSTIANCSLIVDGVVDSVAYPPIYESEVNFFYPRIPVGGWHNWSVNCSDYYGNVGASDKWLIFIAPPDLIVNASSMFFSNSSPIEGENITINGTVWNIGGSDALNVVIQFWLGDPDVSGVQINDNFTVNITDIDGNNSAVTVNVSWTVSGPGPFNFYLVADPPTALNGSINESIESNNKFNKTLQIDAWFTAYGDVLTTFVLANSNNGMYLNWTGTNFSGNIFVAETNADVDWTSLQALSRDISDIYQADDFGDFDFALNMSNFSDSVNITYTDGFSFPKVTSTFNVYSSDIFNVPVINSTNSSNFVSGILWDTSDGGVEYSGTQDVVFVTGINQTTPGYYGIYDFEITFPVLLRDYKEIVSSTISYYYEII